MAISEWYQINNVPVGSERRADGKWRVEYNDMMTRLRVSTNHKTYSDWVNSGLDLDAYRQMAEHIIADLNRRPH
jgi:hypothetical protein